MKIKQKQFSKTIKRLFVLSVIGLLISCAAFQLQNLEQMKRGLDDAARTLVPEYLAAKSAARNGDTMKFYEHVQKLQAACQYIDEVRNYAEAGFYQVNKEIEFRSNEDSNNAKRCNAYWSTVKKSDRLKRNLGNEQDPAGYWSYCGCPETVGTPISIDQCDINSSYEMIRKETKATYGGRQATEEDLTNLMIATGPVGAILSITYYTGRSSHRERCEKKLEEYNQMAGELNREFSREESEACGGTVPFANRDQVEFMSEQYYATAGEERARLNKQADSLALLNTDARRVQYVCRAMLEELEGLSFVDSDAFLDEYDQDILNSQDLDSGYTPPEDYTPPAEDMPPAGFSDPMT